MAKESSMSATGRWSARRRKYQAAISHLLRLSDIVDNGSPRQPWKVSIVRIVLSASTVLAVGIAALSFSDAVTLNKLPVIALILISYVTLTFGLRLSSRYPNFSSCLLIGLVYMTGGVFLLFNSMPAVVNLGVVFLYAAPVMTLLLFGVRYALAAMAFNLIPYLFILYRPTPLVLFGLDMSLPRGYGYVHSLFFMFFNLCIPLALFRVLKAVNFTRLRYAKTNARLKRSNALYRDMFEHAGGPTLICDRDGRVLKSNRRAKALFDIRQRGRAAHNAKLDQILMNAEGAIDPGTVVQLARTIGVGEAEFSIRQNDGAKKDIYLRAIQLSSNQNLLVTARDLTSLRSTQRELARTRERENHIENHDFLTDLPNRQNICDMLDEALAYQRNFPNGALIAVASIRLNSVRHVNEKFGIAAGDQLIMEFAGLLQRMTTNHSFIGRLHGVVFALLLTACESASGLVNTIEDIKASLPTKLEIGGKTVMISTSIGVAFSRDENVAADELIRRSDHALEIARKSPERSFTFFDEDIAREAHRAIDIEVALGAAIERGELAIHYQPKVRSNGEIESLEALLRWTSSELGPVSPAEFIPIAEETGLIHALTNHVIELVCRQIREWLDRYQRTWPVAINLSGHDLHREDISRLIAFICSRYSIPHKLVQLEITETGLIENGETAARHLRYFAENGFAIALDDFGTGYSSLAKLSEFPISILKIDRSFVSGIGHHERREQIVRATLSLAQVLNCTTVAEGVETTEQLNFLIDHGCDLFQGFLFHRPLPAGDMAKLISARKSSMPLF